MGSSSSTCASPSLSIATAYDQFSQQIKYEDDWKDNASLASMCSPRGSYGNTNGTNNLSTMSMTFTPPPLPITSQSPFVNGNSTAVQANSTSSGMDLFQGFTNNSSMMASTSTTPRYFGDGSNSFPSNNQTSFESGCTCKTGYTCSKCLDQMLVQKTMEG